MTVAPTKTTNPQPISHGEPDWRDGLPKLSPATKPPEFRGLSRDGIRLLVSGDGGESIEHRRFAELGRILEPEDAVVVNVSAVRPAAFRARRLDGTELLVHLSTRLPGDVWIVELRRPTGGGARPFPDGVAGESLRADGARVELLAPYRAEHRTDPGDVRLWLADVELARHFLERRAEPIRYDYVDDDIPQTVDVLQNVYAAVPGSAEPPSAGRGFSSRLLDDLRRRGIDVLPVLLHCGVSSLEADEPPHEEYFEVGHDTARAIRSVRRRGGRVVAVGTTVMRTLESALDVGGEVRAARGWTDLVFEPGDVAESVDGLISGFHPPDASHLDVLSSIAGEEQIRHAYEVAERQNYLAHEFGDAHLLWRS